MTHTHDHGPGRGRPGHRHHHGHHHAEHHDHQAGRLSRLRHGFSELVGGHSHDASDQIDDALEANAAGRRALLISLVGLGLTAALQAVVVLLSGSVALLGDTLHNLADALTAVPLLVAFALARRPANKRYTYGYGRAEDLAGLFIVATDRAVGWSGRLSSHRPAAASARRHPPVGRRRRRPDRL